MTELELLQEDDRAPSSSKSPSRSHAVDARTDDDHVERGSQGRSAACGLARRARGGGRQSGVRRGAPSSASAFSTSRMRSATSPSRVSRPRARYASLTPVRRASSRITWSDGIRSPLSMREMYAALQPGKASSRWLRPAASCLVKPLPDSDWVVVVRDAGTFVRHHHTKDSNACSWQRKATRLTRWTEAR